MNIALAILFYLFGPAPQPPGCGAFVLDNYNNRWAICRGELHLLPAQADQAWIKQSEIGLKYLAVDDFGVVWIASETVVKSLDPRAPEKGWIRHAGRVKFLKLATSGRMQIADGIELDADPKAAAQTPGWIKDWEVADLLPGANHDLSGDVLEGKFWFAGGQTAEWGYPATRHIFDGIYYLSKGRIEQAGKLQAPRYYNGTSWLGGKIWIVGGSRRDAQWNAHDLNTVEIFDPKTGFVTDGPTLPGALEMALAQNIGGRIYAAGAPMGAPANSPLKLYSIGTGESEWRLEPDGPSGRKNIAGTSLNGKFYVIVPDTGLAVFDPATKAWSVIQMTAVPRSAQIAAYKNEIWMAGGRDIPSGTQTTIYSPATGSFRPGPALPRELSWGAAAVVEERFYVIGGAGGRCYSNKVFRLK